MAETDGSRFSDGGNEHGDSGDGRVGGSGVTSGRGGGGRGLECVLRISHPDPQWLYCSSSSVDERRCDAGKRIDGGGTKGKGGGVCGSSAARQLGTSAALGSASRRAPTAEVGGVRSSTVPIRARRRAPRVTGQLASCVPASYVSVACVRSQYPNYRVFKFLLLAPLASPLRLAHSITPESRLPSSHTHLSG